MGALRRNGKRVSALRKLRHMTQLALAAGYIGARFTMC